MGTGIVAQARNVSGEPLSRVFGVVLRGYDRHQVDERIEQLEDQARQYRGQTHALRRELSAVQCQLRERECASYAGLGAGVEELLRLAEEQATELLGKASAVAGELRAEAEATPRSCTCATASWWSSGAPAPTSTPLTSSLADRAARSPESGVVVGQVPAQPLTAMHRASSGGHSVRPEVRGSGVPVCLGA
jgi:hypothetical protein